MTEHSTKLVRELVDSVYRSESRQVLATLIRLLGDFDAAEEALPCPCPVSGSTREPSVYHSAMRHHRGVANEDNTIL